MKAACHKRRSPNQKCNQKRKGSKELAKFASRWGGGEGGGGVLPYKSDRGARRTFQGFKFVDWYQLGC